MVLDLCIRRKRSYGILQSLVSGLFQASAKSASNELVLDVHLEASAPERDVEVFARWHCG